MRISRYDRLEDIFHLTPSGWVHSRSIERGDFVKDERPPPDRVETWRRLRVAGTDVVRANVHWERLWVNDAVSIDERDALRGRNPFPGSDPGG